jgi:hypothetical protein
MSSRSRSRCPPTTCSARLTASSTSARFGPTWHHSIARPADLRSIPNLLIRMLIIGYCYGSLVFRLVRIRLATARENSTIALCQSIFLNFLRAQGCQHAADLLATNAPKKKEKQGEGETIVWSSLSNLRADHSFSSDAKKEGAVTRLYGKMPVLGVVTRSEVMRIQEEATVRRSNRKIEAPPRVDPWGPSAYLRLA